MAGRAEDVPSAELLDSALTGVVRQTGASVGGIYLIGQDEPVLHLVVMTGFPTDVLGPWTRVSLAARLPVADAVREHRVVWVGSQEELVRSYPSAAVALPYRFSLAAVPVPGASRPVGVLLLVWPGGQAPHLTPRRRGHITSSGRRIGRLLEELARTARPLPLPDEPRIVPPAAEQPPSSSPAAADFAERLPGGSVALDLDGRITFVTGAAADLLGGERTQLLGTLPWQSLPWLDDPVYEDYYRSAVISREPTSYLALRPPDHWLKFELYPDASGISVRITPAAPGTSPPPRSRALMPGAAPTGAGRLYQLMHLAAGLTEAVGVQDVVDVVADQIMPAFGAHGLVLSIAEGGRLRILGHRGYDAETVERLDALPLDSRLTPAGHVMTSGSPAFFDNREELGQDYPLAPVKSGKNAWAFLPLIVSGQPVGCWSLTYEHPHAFTADERAVLISLAGLVAQALDRARLYDAKKALAHGLQQALLPHVLPSLEGLDVAGRYLPATHGMDIGGDFYDLISLDDHTCAAVIGDVQGHNVAAAALMGQVRTAVHAHSTAGSAPDEVLARTNRLLNDLDPGLLVSCLYAHIDLARHQVIMSSAGHPPPLVRAGGCRTEVLDVEPGPMLGVYRDQTFPTASVRVPQGALLAFYTDGLVERPGADLDRATRGLAEHLAETDVRDLDAVIDSLVHYARPTGYHSDDIALLLLRLTG